MLAELPTIHAVEELLGLMRESPSTRLVITSDRLDWRGHPLRAVCEERNDADDRTLLALIAPESAADGLFDDVMRADAARNGKREWKRLPLRYHAFYSACLLPEHPHAPRKPGREPDDLWQQEACRPRLVWTDKAKTPERR